MRSRVSLSALTFSLLLAAFVAPVCGQSPAQSSAPEQVSIAADALPQAISSLLEKGSSFEKSGRWPEALSYYEESLRAHPEDPALTGRFDVARMHYTLEQRYDDRSFRDSLSSLKSQDAINLYDDLLNKIGTHYYTTPPWQELANRGSRALDIALAEPKFLEANNVHPSVAQLKQLDAALDQLQSRSPVTSQRDAVAVATQAAQIARRQIGLSETATALEYTSAAATGLDHYSSFLTADQLRDIYSQIEGNFVGLGVELKADNGALLIVHVIPNSPAQKAGINDGDRIVAVDGNDTKTLSTDEAASLLTGPEGSNCRVSVSSPGVGVRELNIHRESVEVPSLEGVKIIDQTNGVAYVRIPAFQKTTARDLEAALWELHGKGMRSLVLDLRGNPGGLLTASVEVADEFIADGGIVTTRGRSEQENFNYRAHRPGTWRVPLVVLIDGDSASASEIFAAAIKDSGRGKIIGVRSYGKGSVQGIFPLGYAGAGARITTAKFFSPLGHPISNVGVNPDIDARRATAVTSGEQQLAAGTQLAAKVSPTTTMYQTGYRGPEANVAPATAAAPAATSASSDEALDLAVQVARTQPVVQF